jgi:predicted DNA-binding protein YlxM (UPF0122 family)
MAKKVEKYELTEKQEQYLQIYHEYFVLKWSWDEICKYHDCSKTKVTNAVKWVIANRLEFPSKNLIKGAIDAIKIRMKKNNEMYEKEISKKRYRDNAFIISLSREIREDEKTLYKLEEIYNDGQDDASLSAGQVLKLIKAASDEGDNN